MPAAWRFSLASGVVSDHRGQILRVASPDHWRGAGFSGFPDGA